MTIKVGSRVYLKGAAFGVPGSVLRVQGKRITVLWGDLNYLAHHRLETLMEAPRDPATSTGITYPLSRIGLSARGGDEMKPGDKVQMREAPETRGTVRKLAGHQVIVQWPERTTTKVPKYMLKPQQQRGETHHAR